MMRLHHDALGGVVMRKIAHDALSDVVTQVGHDALGAEGIRLGFLLGLSLMSLNWYGVA